MPTQLLRRLGHKTRNMHYKHRGNKTRRNVSARLAPSATLSGGDRRCPPRKGAVQGVPVGRATPPVCHPARSTRKLHTTSKVSQTCYTPHILNTIKDAYNKANPNDAIVASEPSDIWHALHSKLDHCEKEDCWLNVIADTKLRKQIDRYVFAPDKPPEWNADPNAWLSNYDIMNVLEQYETAHSDFNFIGPTPIDFDAKPTPNGKCVWNELCTFDLEAQMKKGYTQFGIIFNTDDHLGGGEHWVSLYIDVPHKIAFYFDSANGETPTEIVAFVTRVQKQAKRMGMKLAYTRNHTKHQQSNTECGMYSLFFIITMLTCKVEGKPISKPARLKLFHGKKRIPDKYIQKYRNIYFND